MPNILIIAYYFPPLGGAGVQRSLKFVKFLPTFNWQATVLTVHENTNTLKDATLVNDIPARTNIYRTWIPLLPKSIPWRVRNWISRWFFVVDEQIGWFPLAIRNGLNIIKSENIQAIFSSSGPYTCHLIGRFLKQKTGLPWIADFRDPWIGNFTSSYPTLLHDKLNSGLERNVIYDSDAIIVVSQPMRQAFLDSYNNIKIDKIHVIPNGYDPEDFINVKPAIRNPNKFTIVYSGSFYSLGRTAENFLLGLNHSIDNRSIPRESIEISFIGNISKLTRQHINSLNLNDVVKCTGYLSHEESISHLLCSDILLLVVGSGRGSEAIYTGKLFEYLAARKPILALADPGVASQLIETTQAGVVISPNNIPEISNQITHFYNLWQNNNLYYLGDSKIISQYTRKKLTGELVQILNKVIK
jgi:glycosyltransferase involved in cell wall biosynthesis